MTIERVTIDGEPRRLLRLLAEVTFADREAGPRDEWDHNYYEDSELEDVATGWMSDGLEDRDDSPAVTFKDLPSDPAEVLAAVLNALLADGRRIFAGGYDGTGPTWVGIKRAGRRTDLIEYRDGAYSVVRPEG